MPSGRWDLLTHRNEGAQYMSVKAQEQKFCLAVSGESSLEKGACQLDLNQEDLSRERSSMSKGHRGRTNLDGSRKP